MTLKSYGITVGNRLLLSYENKISQLTIFATKEDLAVAFMSLLALGQE